MTFEEAVVQAIKSYWKDQDHEKMASNKNSKYSKKYFDSVEAEQIGKQSVKDTKKKTKEEYK